jgi:hypothetical protein
MSRFFGHFFLKNALNLGVSRFLEPKNRGMSRFSTRNRWSAYIYPVRKSYGTKMSKKNGSRLNFVKSGVFPLLGLPGTTFLAIFHAE